MTKRIFQSISLAAFGVLLASLAMIFGVLYGYFSQQQLRQQWQQTELAAQGAAREGLSYFEGLELAQCRVTWVAADGAVLYDSQADPAALENHLEREEVQQALESGSGQSVRHSQSLTRDLCYTAQRLPDGSVLRLASSRQSVFTLLLGVFQPVCAVVLVAVCLCLLLASQLSKSIVEPLNQLDLDHPLENRPYDEIEPLLRRLDTQQRTTRTQARELRQRREEFETITGRMREGLVLLNEHNKILTLNETAAAMLFGGTGCVGKDITAVCRAPALPELLLLTRGGRCADCLLEQQGRLLRLEASPVLSEGALSGVALLVMDVTEKEQAERLRREFTANVSHELKTPLHTISGCAELLCGGLVQPGDEQRFSRQIYAEAQRMVRLVEDIIALSRLDEGAGDLEWEQVDLLAAARAAAESLRPMARAAEVTLAVEGQPVEVRAIPQLVETILSNLCSNAIKYNHAGGRVELRAEPTPEGVRLTVRDTGIGIPPEHQPRVFERFYRVDKSRSKEVGGTGLGLSLVKHAAMVLGARLGLESQLGEGTTVTVLFPKE